MCTKRVRKRPGRCCSTFYPAAIAAAAFGAASMAFVGPARAVETPPGCTSAGAGASMTRIPATEVQHGQEMCYRIQYFNGEAGVNCEIRNFDADLFLPDGTSIPMLRGVTILSGTSVSCPSADPRCETLSNCGIPGQTGYSYIVSHADEVLNFTGCPPVTTAGIGKVVAYTEGNGDSLTEPPDFAAACATANNILPHGACCEPCTGTCTDNVTANECPTTSQFILGALCSQIDCSLNCDDGNDCTTDVCIPWDRSDPDPANWVAAYCTNTSFCIDPPPDFTCDDDNVCTLDTCDETVEGCCTHEEIPCEERPCYNLIGCDPVLGCQYESVCTDPDYCDDQNVCTLDTCDETVDGCCTHEEIPCEPRPCYEVVGCDPITGCQYESVCVLHPDYCDDGDPCTEDRCDESLEGCCEHVWICQEELCRTPGFWGTHACGPDGVTCEKPTSSNVTQTVIDNCGGCMNVCGDIIDTTVLDNADSALEAMCVSPSGRPILQLVRQLTAAALNCCISGSDGTCNGISVEPVYTACNAACVAGMTTAEIGGHTFGCIDAIDCFNNGGLFHLDTGFCQTGTCANGDACSEKMSCADGSMCTLLPNNCHERAEDMFGICADGTLCLEGTCADESPCKPGPAGSSKACNDATRNRCNVYDGAFCATGDNGAETCDANGVTSKPTPRLP